MDEARPERSGSLHVCNDRLKRWLYKETHVCSALFRCVRLKLLLCVNKEDRKWQFGSSNQECHSQLRPLPAPDTSLGPKRSRDTPFQCHLHNASQSRRRQNDVQKTRAGATAAHFSERREADVLGLPSSSGQSCQDLLVKDTEDSEDGKNELLEVFSLFLCQEWHQRQANPSGGQQSVDVLPRVVPGEVPGGPRHILRASALRLCPRHKDTEVVRTNRTKSHTSSHPLSWPTEQLSVCLSAAVTHSRVIARLPPPPPPPPPPPVARFGNIWWFTCSTHHLPDASQAVAPLAPLRSAPQQRNDTEITGNIGTNGVR
ncbi:unnamed protein product [Pleuronectes platessa]|uniref:Uncharacterized protein n=1 Tax=Pleuronectes platessa TaxID=8262 RepID=A0A9N7URB4_PLEPL|nr:unnamed protein product [Pleuronectes platessa]